MTGFSATFFILAVTSHIWNTRRFCKPSVRHLQIKAVSSQSPFMNSKSARGYRITASHEKERGRVAFEHHILSFSQAAGWWFWTCTSVELAISERMYTRERSQTINLDARMWQGGICLALLTVVQSIAFAIIWKVGQVQSEDLFLLRCHIRCTICLVSKLCKNGSFSSTWHVSRKSLKNLLQFSSSCSHSRFLCNPFPTCSISFKPPWIDQWSRGLQE